MRVLFHGKNVSHLNRAHGKILICRNVVGCVLTLGRAAELEGGGGGDNSVGEESEE